MATKRETPACTYREGAWVFDTRTGVVGRVMDHQGPYAQLRAPGGGREWDAPPTALRLATEPERRAAGVTSNGKETKTCSAPYSTASGTE